MFFFIQLSQYLNITTNGLLTKILNSNQVFVPSLTCSIERFLTVYSDPHPSLHILGKIELWNVLALYFDF